MLNNRYNKVALDNIQETKNIYLEDLYGSKYYWLNFEHIENDLILNKGLNKKLSIKFNKEYDSSSDANKLVFKNVILDDKENIEFVIDI